MRARWGRMGRRMDRMNRDALRRLRPWLVLLAWAIVHLVALALLTGDFWPAISLPVCTFDADAPPVPCGTMR